MSDAKQNQKKNDNGKGEEAYLQGPHLYTLCKLLAHSSPLHTPESPPFFRLLKMWKLKAFKTKL
jgi:hypothetical protein